MSNCFGCDYYDASVDCCNGDDVCYADGYEDGYQKAIEICIDKIKSYSDDDKLMNDWYVEKLEELKVDK